MMNYAFADVMDDRRRENIVEMAIKQQLEMVKGELVR